MNSICRGKEGLYERHWRIAKAYRFRLGGCYDLDRLGDKDGEADFLYSMLKKRELPGYLYMIDQGASTTWEYWSGGT